MLTTDNGMFYDGFEWKDSTRLSSNYYPGQLEIKYFFPLTEQINLDLNFTPCEEYDKQKFSQQIWPVVGGTGMVLMSNGGNVTWSQRIGDWELPSETKQPSKFQKFMMKYFFGWKWMGK